MVSQMGGNTEKQDKKKKILRSLPARLHTALLAGCRSLTLIWDQVPMTHLSCQTRPLRIPFSAQIFDKGEDSRSLHEEVMPCKSLVQSVICMAHTWQEEHKPGICRSIRCQFSRSGYALSDLPVTQPRQFLVTVLLIEIPALSYKHRVSHIKGKMEIAMPGFAGSPQKPAKETESHV